MRTKFLLTLCLAAMPMCMVGYESESGSTVGTGNGEPPPDVKKRIEEQSNSVRWTRWRRSSCWWLILPGFNSENTKAFCNSQEAFFFRRVIRCAWSR